MSSIQYRVTRHTESQEKNRKIKKKPSDQSQLYRCWNSPSGDLPNPGIKPRSPTLQVDSLPAEPAGKPRELIFTGEVGDSGPLGGTQFPRWCSGKEPACNAGDAGHVGSIPGSGRSPGEGNGNPSQYSCLGKPMERGV